ncbi:ankyrin repeat domain-containing protein [Endozoicomonas sp. GU-1]|nr:ankyrin repeat domain-containing protein [Endozoicomonas sp. GU-1]WBA85181.1 ankyrin repeat domain-containing protein [Endozoicomonas sp. GU-1]
MWRSTQKQLSFTLSKHAFQQVRNNLEGCLKKNQDRFTELLEEVKNDFQKERGSTHRPPILDDTIRKIENNIEVLKTEQHKLKKDEFVLSVFGAFNSGKSTTINAIVGMENLPYRDSAMTALPTLIRHTPGNAHPVLKLGDKTDTLNNLLSTLREEMATGLDKKNKPLKKNRELLKLQKNIELEQVLEEIVKPDYKFKSRYHKEDEIQKCLLELNYVFRMLEKLSKESNKIEFNIEEFFQQSSIPVVEVEFTALRDVRKDDECSFSLMDTPGYGESKEGSEKILELIEKLLVKSSTAIAVLDKGYLEGSISEDIYDRLEKFAKSQPNDVYVWVNKFDQKKSKDRGVPEIKDIVSNNVEHVKPYNIFPVSSHYAYLAYMVERELNTNGCLKEAKNKSWVQDFFNAHYPTATMEEEYLGKENQAMVRRDVERLRNLSRYKEAIETCISSPYTSAQLLIIASATMKLEESESEIKEIEEQKRKMHVWKANKSAIDKYKTRFGSLTAGPAGFLSCVFSGGIFQALVPAVTASTSMAVALPPVAGIIGGVTALYYGFKFGEAVAETGYSWLYPDPDFLAQRSSSEPKQPTELYKILEKYKNPEPNQNAPHNMSPKDCDSLIEALNNEDDVTVRNLIEKGINVNTNLGNGDTPLHLATQNGSACSVKSLIGEGRGRAMEIIRIMSLATSMIKTAINDGKFAAVMDLIYKSRDFCDAIKNLTHRGADVNATNEKGYTPLHLAAEGNQKECLQHLVNAGANVNSIEKKVGKTPLHIAAQHGNNECLEVLLSKKTDVTESLKAAYENLKQAYIVIDDARQKNDESKISIAVKILQLLETTLPALTALADVGVNINARTKNGETPLHIAAECGNDKCVELLIKNGTDLSAKTAEGDTPLDLAAMKSNPKCKRIVQILKEELGKQKSRNTPTYSFAT